MVFGIGDVNCCLTVLRDVSCPIHFELLNLRALKNVQNHDRGHLRS